MSQHGPRWSPGQHIDQTAKPIFETSMLGWAVPSALSPDMGIDYSVELLAKCSDRDIPSADGDFLVQLKGESDAKYSNGFLSQSFSTRRLRYFLEKKRRPIFLVVIDINTGQGYWKFLQRFAAEEVDQQKLSLQESVTIPIPLGQSLADQIAFRAAISDADQWISNRWPGLPHVAANHLKAKIERDDPRVNVEVFADSSTTHIVVYPKEPISFSIEIEGAAEAVRRFHQDAVGRGLPVQPSNYGVTVRGRGLPGRKDPEEISALQMANKLSGHAVLTPVSTTKQHSGQSLTLSGELQMGTSECRFRGKLASGVFCMDLTLPIPERPPPNMALTSQASFQVEWKAWKGRRLSQLPDFGVLERFFRGFSDDDHVTIELFCDGNSLCSAQMQGELLAGLRNFAAGIDLFGIARRLTKTWAPELDFNGEILDVDRNSLCVLEELDRGVPFPLNKAELAFSQIVSKGEIPNTPIDGAANRIVVESRDCVTLFGHSISLGVTRRECPAVIAKLVSREADPSAPGTEILKWKLMPQAPWLFSIVPTPDHPIAGQAAETTSTRL